MEIHRYLAEAEKNEKSRAASDAKIGKKLQDVVIHELKDCHFWFGSLSMQMHLMTGCGCNYS